MKIVIDIDEVIYKYIKKFDEIPTCGNIVYDACITGVHKGKLIPKEHGDLIDRSKIGKAIPAEEDNCTGMRMSYDEMDAYNEGIDIMYSRIQDAPTIIEAEGSESE